MLTIFNNRELILCGKNMPVTLFPLSRILGGGAIKEGGATNKNWVAPMVLYCS